MNEWKTNKLLKKVVQGTYKNWQMYKNKILEIFQAQRKLQQNQKKCHIG